MFVTCMVINKLIDTLFMQWMGYIRREKWNVMLLRVAHL